jgi:hypothetical protein
MSRRSPCTWRGALATSALASAAVAIGWACGGGVDRLITSPGAPVDRAAYDRGELGVVKPTYGRLALIQAYRVTQGLMPLADPDRGTPHVAGAVPPEIAEPLSALLRESVKQTWPVRDPIWRDVGNYQSIDNCLPDAFTHAKDTLAARAARYGAGDRAVADWLAGQIAVFRNCSGDPAKAPILPAPAPDWADARLRADRAYQQAAAAFYAVQFDDAARRFDAIAADAASEWQPAGAYLAARAFIRSALVPDDPPSDAAARFAHAERRLQAALAEPRATRYHASAQGLLGLVAARLRPRERLHELGARLRLKDVPDPQDVADYLWLHRRWIDVESGVPAGARDEDLANWMLAARAGDHATAYAQWGTRQTDAWLLAALWSATGTEPHAGALAAAAAKVPSTASWHAAAVLQRLRLLIALRRTDEARSLLATLPRAPAAGFDREAINLLEGHRMGLARSLDEFLAHAPRMIVAEAELPWDVTMLETPEVMWDTDAVLVLDAGLPIEQLLAAATSSRLPAPLRTHVVRQALTRALLLERTPEASALARLLRRQAPSLRPSLDAYLSATTDQARARAALLFFLRNRDLSVNVPEAGDWENHGWWCASDAGLLPLGAELPWISAAQRQAAADELKALRGLPSPRVLFTEAALTWARAAPSDAGAAEALARAVAGWRTSHCRDGSPDLPKRAFQTLHEQFPQSAWAERTPYWYK